MEVRGNMIWFTDSFLSDRLIKVRMGNTFSSPSRLEGVPHGIVLSVTCFAVAMNSFIAEVSSSVRASLFVDLAVYCTAYDIESSCRYLQKGKRKIDEYKKDQNFSHEHH